MSKFLVHIRMSEKENFVNEHEIFEMMRSRHLYQMQFDLRRKLEKRIRAIQLEEKVHISTFQSKKTVFLNKMKEKIRQKNLKRYSLEIGKGISHDFEQENELSSEDGEIVLATNGNITNNNEKTLTNIRPKSLVTCNILQNENIERPVTSRSMVSLHGRTFPVVKSSGRSRALVTEATLYPDDLLAQVQNANNIVETRRRRDDKNTCSTEKLTKKNIQFNVKGTDPQTDGILSLPQINNADIFKNLATFEMGTLTPDGHLILTRDDYNEYMDKFQRKREKRLHRMRMLSKSLDQKVSDFFIAEEM